MSNELLAMWGQRLKELRKEQGLSLRQVCEAIGLHKSNYCRIEAGEAVPSDGIRIRIAALYRKRVEEIFSYPTAAQAPRQPAEQNAGQGTEQNRKA